MGSEFIRVDEDEERGESSKFPSTYLTTVTLIRLFTKHLCSNWKDILQGVIKLLESLRK